MGTWAGAQQAARGKMFFSLNWLHSGAQIQLKSTPQPCGPRFDSFGSLSFLFVLSMTINCFSGTFPEVPGSTPLGASPF